MCYEDREKQRQEQQTATEERQSGNVTTRPEQTTGGKQGQQEESPELVITVQGQRLPLSEVIEAIRTHPQCSAIVVSGVFNYERSQMPDDPMMRILSGFAMLRGQEVVMGKGDAVVTVEAKDREALNMALEGIKRSL